jgi:peptidyl-prolyl isomerase G (cyclophilin G)
MHPIQESSDISATALESGSDREARKRKASRRRRRDSRSLSPVRDSDIGDRLEKKKDRKSKTSKESKKLKTNADGSDQFKPRKETEEEYDARLEREENERLEDAKRRELERAADSLLSVASKEEGGIRYKGTLS